MATPENIGDAIEQAAVAPKRIKTKSTEVEEHSLADLIAADNHVASKAAASKNHMGLRFGKIVPPGAG